MLTFLQTIGQPSFAFLILAGASIWIGYCDRRAREQTRQQIAPHAHGSRDDWTPTGH